MQRGQFIDARKGSKAAGSSRLDLERFPSDRNRSLVRKSRKTRKPERRSDSIKSKPALNPACVSRSARRTNHAAWPGHSLSANRSERRPPWSNCTTSETKMSNLLTWPNFDSPIASRPDLTIQLHKFWKCDQIFSTRREPFSVHVKLYEEYGLKTRQWKSSKVRWLSQSWGVICLWNWRAY